MSNVSSAINNLNNSVESFQSQVNVHVNNVDTSTKKVQEVAESVYKRVDEFRKDIMHGEEKQIAHENIMRLDQVIKEQFGNYDAIRKTIIGIVRDFDINLAQQHHRGIVRGTMDNQFKILAFLCASGCNCVGK